MGRVVIIGSSPLAAGIATRCSMDNESVLLSARATSGPFLWQRADPTSGEAIRAATKNADKIIIVSRGAWEPPPLGAILAAKQCDSAIVTYIDAAGMQRPQVLESVPSWPTLTVGAVWGVEEPLVQAWTKAIGNDQHIWVPHTHPINALSITTAAKAVLAISARPNAHWQIGGQVELTLKQLAKAIADNNKKTLRSTRAPLAWSMGRIAVNPDCVTAWTHMSTPTETDDWNVPYLPVSTWFEPSETAT